MSFIRALSKREYSIGSLGLYVYPTEIPETKEQAIEFAEGIIPSEDFVEVMFRVLERSRVEFTLEDVNRVRKALYLEHIDINED